MKTFFVRVLMIPLTALMVVSSFATTGTLGFCSNDSVYQVKQVKVGGFYYENEVQQDYSADCKLIEVDNGVWSCINNNHFIVDRITVTAVHDDGSDISSTTLTDVCVNNPFGWTCNKQTAENPPLVGEDNTTTSRTIQGVAGSCTNNSGDLVTQIAIKGNIAGQKIPSYELLCGIMEGAWACGTPEEGQITVDTISLRGVDASGDAVITETCTNAAAKDGDTYVLNPDRAEDTSRLSWDCSSNTASMNNHDIQRVDEEKNRFRKK